MSITCDIRGVYTHSLIKLVMQKQHFTFLHLKYRLSAQILCFVRIWSCVFCVIFITFGIKVHNKSVVLVHHITPVCLFFSAVCCTVWFLKCSHEVCNTVLGASIFLLLFACLFVCSLFFKFTSDIQICGTMPVHSFKDPFSFILLLTLLPLLWPGSSSVHPFKHPFTQLHTFITLLQFTLARFIKSSFYLSACLSLTHTLVHTHTHSVSLSSSL